MKPAPKPAPVDIAAMCRDPLLQRAFRRIDPGAAGALVSPPGPAPVLPNGIADMVEPSADFIALLDRVIEGLIDLRDRLDTDPDLEIDPEIGVDDEGELEPDLEPDLGWLEGFDQTAAYRAKNSFVLDGEEETRGERPRRHVARPGDETRQIPMLRVWTRDCVEA